MRVDARLQFGDAVTGISAASTNTLRGDVIDLGESGGDPVGGAANPMQLVIVITTAFVSANNNPTVFELASDAQAAIAVDGTATEHILTESYLPADLPAGRRLVYNLPPQNDAKPYERFLGVIQRVGAGASGVTAGAFSAFLSRDVASWKAYPDAVN
ncbi:hypothetical protein COW64_17305 [bacterium (Candidatus Blackallbacteria) CG18_big_fil_WC_8_21_14_2_50_49_26]|nr:MAG: hypothetical protein COW64_17305 [bacterium (Candidatus Blackallbacteria) CG18_big_fil_WC_8_21_14_2_50_49_26]